MEEKIVVSVDQLISIIKKRIREKRGIISRIAMDEHSSPSNITQRFQKLYKNLSDLREELMDVFSTLKLENILIDMKAEPKETELSKESLPTIKRKKRRDPKEEGQTKRIKNYQVYLKRATKIPGFAKFLRPPAGFWEWFENNPASAEIRGQVATLLKRIKKNWGVKPYNLEKWKRNLMRMLISGFPYRQIELTLDFLEKNPKLAEKYKSDLGWDLGFLERLRFEAFKNSDEFTEILKEKFPLIWEEHRWKDR